MREAKSYFFCGIGGSGMLPLALIVQAQGHKVKGSDRTLDQGRLADKFADLRANGIALFPQDGSGLTSADQIVVASAAVEDSVPDIVRANALGCARITRAELLALLFNAAETGIAVGGTSGKSTVTGMIGWILAEAGRDPTIMNGAVMRNFGSGARVGAGGVFVSEVDESDGSIALYRPKVAVLNNISLDHKSLDELRRLFRDFAARAETVVANLDDDETRVLAALLPPERLGSYSFGDESSALFGSDIEEAPFAVSFKANGVPVRLRIPGRYNAQNALAAIAAVQAIGVPIGQAAAALAGFKGTGRRFEKVGEASGVTVIDDFAHNPDKLTATLRTLHAFPGRLLLFFQPHGFGPLKQMKDELIAAFAAEMAAEDVLIMPDPVYYGGTTDRSVGSGAIVVGVAERGRQAEHVSERAACGDRLAMLARPGDRIVVMGARDDTLTLFCEDIVAKLAAKSG